MSSSDSVPISKVRTVGRVVDALAPSLPILFEICGLILIGGTPTEPSFVTTRPKMFVDTLF